MKILKEYQSIWSSKRIRWEFSSPQGSNRCLFSPMRQSQTQVVIVNNPNYFIKERTPFRRPRRSSHHHLDFVILWSLITTDKISKHLFLGASEIWLHPALKSFKMGEHSAGGVGFDQTATIFAPLRRIKNTTLTCALTGWKSSASPVRCNNRVWVCPLFGVSFNRGFSQIMGNVQLQKNIQYSNMHLWLKLGNQNYQRIHHWWIGAKAPSFSRIFIHVFDAAHHVFEDLFNGF